MTINVVIADDQQLVRTGFRMILEDETDIHVVGEATNGSQAVTLARQLHSDVVLMDIRMPELDGIAATRQITSDPRSQRVRVLILTTFDLDEYVFDALRAGASGFLLKDTPAVDLVAAIRIIAGGESLLAPSVTRRLIAEFAATPPASPPPAGFAELTARELEVFGLVAEGLSNAEIAARLVIAETTVKTHVAHLLTKLDLRDRVQAVVLAYQTGVVASAKQPDRSRRTSN